MLQKGVGLLSILSNCHEELHFASVAFGAPPSQKKKHPLGEPSSSYWLITTDRAKTYQPVQVLQKEPRLNDTQRVVSLGRVHLGRLLGAVVVTRG